MRFAPTTSQPPPRLSSPHQPDLPENQYSYRPPPQTPSEPSHPGAPPTFHATHPLLPFSSADSHSGFAASELDFHSPSLSLPLRDPLPPRRSGQPSRHTLRLRVSLSATLTPRPAFSPPSILLIPFRFILIHRLFLSLSLSLSLLFLFSLYRYPASSSYKGIALAPPYRFYPFPAPTVSSHVPRGSVAFFEPPPPPMQTRPTTPLLAERLFKAARYPARYIQRRDESLTDENG